MSALDEKHAKHLRDLRTCTIHVTDLVGITNTLIAPELYFMAVDSESVILFASENWCSLYDCEINELVGHSLFEWVADENYDQVMEYWTTYKDLPKLSGEPFKSINKRKDGSLVELTWKQLELSPIDERSIFYGVCEACEVPNS